MGPTNQTSTLFLGVGLLIMLLCLLPTAESLKCWECTSDYDYRCGEYVNVSVLNEEFRLTDCKHKTKRLQQELLSLVQQYKNSSDSNDTVYIQYPHAPDANATLCRKIVQRVHGTTRVIRSCGYIPEQYKDRNCYRRAGTFEVQVEYCFCNDSDGCNSSPITVPPTLAIVLTTFAAFIPLCEVRWL